MFLLTRVLQPGLFTNSVLTTIGSDNQGLFHPGVLQPGVFYSQGSYNQGFLQPGVLPPDVVTTRDLTTMGSYN